MSNATTNVYRYVEVVNRHQYSNTELCGLSEAYGADFADAPEDVNIASVRVVGRR